MKKIYFILLCVVMTLAMSLSSHTIICADERMEFLVAISAVILAVVAAAQDKDLWRGVFFVAGLIITLMDMGSWPVFIYLFGCGGIIYMMHFYPEVKKMITDLWAPEEDDDAADKKK